MTPESTCRLRTPLDDLREHTKASLAPVRLAPGATALDLGCGSGEVLDLLSDVVGPSGRVVGVDLDEASVASARAMVRRRDLRSVELVRADARSTGLPAASFDLVHMRMLLVAVAAPERVVEEAARLVRPDGWVAIVEPDAALGVGHPPHLDRYVARRLPHLLATAGLERIVVEARGASPLPRARPRDDLGTRLLRVGYFMAWARHPASPPGRFRLALPVKTPAVRLGERTVNWSTPERSGAARPRTIS